MSATQPPIQHGIAEELRKRGFRFTPQRHFILEALSAAHGHCTAEQIFEVVRVYAPGINLATVYRNLDFLLRQDLVTSATIKDNQVIYELRTAVPHHHLVCQRCDATLELPHAVIAPAFRRIRDDLGFDVSTNHIVFFGVCAHCRAGMHAGTVII